MSQPIHGFTDDALGTDDAVGVAERVRSGDVSPLEAVVAAIDRAEKVNPIIAAIQFETFSSARVAASQRERRGTTPAEPFPGVPTFIKDMTHVIGAPTRFGSNAFPTAPVAAKNDTTSRQLFEMGLINLGKSTMPEFGLTCSTEYPEQDATRNPWNPEHSVGGSSGGSAALVAAGVVPIAHTADGGGSTRIPAAACGLVGLKPTAGRLIPSMNTKGQLIPLVVEGVVTRSVRDTARYFSEAEKRYRSSKLPPVGHVDRPLDRPLRIAALVDTPGLGEIDSETQRVFDETAMLLEELGHTVVAQPAMTEQFADDFKAYWAFLAFGALKLGKQVFGPAFEPSLTAEFTKGLAAVGRSHLPKIPGVVRRLRKAGADFERQLGSADMLLTPTMCTLTPKIGHLGMDLTYDVLFPRVEAWAGFTPLANATGAPSISLPIGHNEAANLPIAMMFNAKHGQEALLLELSLQLEVAQPWRQISG